MNLIELEKIIVDNHKYSMEAVYRNIRVAALAGKSELKFKAVDNKDHSDGDMLTDIDYRVLRHDGYDVSYNKFTQEFTVSGWMENFSKGNTVEAKIENY